MIADTFAFLFASAEAWLDGIAGRMPLIVAGLIVFAFFYVLSKLVRRAVLGAARRLDPSLAQMVATLVSIALVIFGVMAGLWIAVPTFSFANIFASLGVTGLILGFALKDIIENFVAGILILWRRPFRVGDQIKSGAYEGTVQEINFRSTVVKTYDGVKVYLPNGKVFTEPLENKTGYPERRTTVVLGIDQNASVGRARGVILQTLAATEGVLREPAPEVFFEEVADFTNNLHVRYWTRPPTRISELNTKSLVTERLYTALQDAGIGFPYPIRTIQVERLGRERRAPDGSGADAGRDGAPKATGAAR